MQQKQQQNVNNNTNTNNKNNNNVVKNDDDDFDSDFDNDADQSTTNNQGLFKIDQSNNNKISNNTPKTNAATMSYSKNKQQINNGIKNEAVSQNNNQQSINQQNLKDNFDDDFDYEEDENTNNVVQNKNKQLNSNEIATQNSQKSLQEKHDFKKFLPTKQEMKKKNYIGDSIIAERNEQDENEDDQQALQSQLLLQENINQQKPGYLAKFSKITQLYDESTKEYKSQLKEMGIKQAEQAIVQKAKQEMHKIEEFKTKFLQSAFGGVITNQLSSSVERIKTKHGLSEGDKKKMLSQIVIKKQQNQQKENQDDQQKQKQQEIEGQQQQKVINNDKNTNKYKNTSSISGLQNNNNDIVVESNLEDQDEDFKQSKIAKKKKKKGKKKKLEHMDINNNNDNDNVDDPIKINLQKDQKNQQLIVIPDYNNNNNNIDEENFDNIDDDNIDGNSTLAQMISHTQDNSNHNNKQNLNNKQVELQQHIQNKKIFNNNDADDGIDWDALNRKNNKKKQQKGNNFQDNLNDEEEKLDLQKRQHTLFTYTQALDYFTNSANLTHLINEVEQSDNQRMRNAGFFSQIASCLFVNKLSTQSLNSQRTLLIAISKQTFDYEIAEHEIMIKSIYKKLMKSEAIQCRSIGNHWVVIGFQSSDPKRDIRGAGMLGILQMLFFIDNYKEAAILILDHSRHQKYEFPLACQMFEYSVLTLRLLKEQKINKFCNKENEVIQTTNYVFAALFLRFITQYIENSYNITKVGELLSSIELESQNSSKLDSNILKQFYKISDKQAVQIIKNCYKKQKSIAEQRLKQLAQQSQSQFVIQKSEYVNPREKQNQQQISSNSINNKARNYAIQEQQQTQQKQSQQNNIPNKQQNNSEFSAF